MKISAVVTVLIIGTILVAFLGLSRMSLINDSLDNIVNKNAARLVIALEIQSVFYLQMLNERNFILEETKEGMQAVRDTMEKRNTQIKKRAEDLHKISSEQGKAEITKFIEVYDKWFANSHEVQQLALAGENKKAFELTQTVGKRLRTEGESYINSTSERNQKIMDQEAETANQLYGRSRTELSITSLLSILISVCIASFVLITLSRTINMVITDLSTNTSQVNGASQQIATSSEELSQASTEQASSLEETVATIEELTSMVKTNTDNAQEASRLSQATSDAAQRGENQIRELVSSMSEISEDSKKIEEIINVIDDIAFQTNLLALNAAVEAARAGEQGKGFAVVAEAVRTLAQRSAAAAKDITDLIKKSVAKIEVGSRQADQSGQVLSEIVNSVQKVAQLNGEIATASNEQSNGILQIGKAMNQLDQVTQINAASSEEAAASAEQLSAQSDSLASVVDLLVLTIKGSQKNSSHLPSPAKARPLSTAAKEPVKERKAQFDEAA